MLTKAELLAKELDEKGHVYVPEDMLENVLQASNCIHYEVEWSPGPCGEDPRWRVSTNEVGQDQ